MLDCTKVRTFTPIIPAGTGPTCTNVIDALLEITRDLYGMHEMGNFEYGEADAEKLAHVLNKGLGDIGDWIDGYYPVIGENYTIEIKTMQQWQLDAMPEFNGY
jgi:hypothetical protein